MDQVTKTSHGNMEQEIAREIHFAMDQLGAPSTLLDWIDRWSEGQDHRGVLAALQVFNDGRSKTPRGGDLRMALANEIYNAFEILGARPILLGLVGTWSEGDDDAMILDGLRVINRKGIWFDGGVVTASEWADGEA